MSDEEEQVVSQSEAESEAEEQNTLEEEEEEVELTKRQKKEIYAEKLRKLLAKYKNILVCAIDFVGSNQMAEIRIALRGRAVVLMGKNTVIRRVLKQERKNNPKLDALLPLVQGNVGFVFTNDEMTEIRTIIQANKVPAGAKVGVFAPNRVIIPAGPTGLDPGQTNFFQVLEIATKIQRGAIEIINDVALIEEGQRVTASHVSLLNKLNIRPFSYGMIVTQAYEDGSVFAAKILDMSQDDLLQKWYFGVRYVAALSMQVGMPTTASIPFSIRRAMRKLLAISLETGYTFAEAEKIKSGASATKKAAPAKEEAKKEEEPEEEEPESSDGPIGGAGLFGGDDDEEEDDEDEEWDEEDDEEEEE